MNKKFVLALALAVGLSVTSCKEESALSKVDPNAVNTPHAAADPILETPPGEGVTVQGPEISQKPEVPADGKYAGMAFTEKEFDFGEIKAGDKVSHVFKFKNNGEKDLIIQSATGSCGCTVPEYPKAPVKPGETAEMNVSFNSAGKHGTQSKTVTVVANVPGGKEVLTIKASIKE